MKHNESSSEDDKSPAAKPLIFQKMKHNRSVDEMDYTDNSSGRTPQFTWTLAGSAVAPLAYSLAGFYQM